MQTLEDVIAYRTSVRLAHVERRLSDRIYSPEGAERLRQLARWLSSPNWALACDLENLIVEDCANGIGRPGDDATAHVVSLEKARVERDRQRHNGHSSLATTIPEFRNGRATVRHGARGRAPRSRKRVGATRGSPRSSDDDPHDLDPPGPPELTFELREHIRRCRDQILRARGVHLLRWKLCRVCLDEKPADAFQPGRRVCDLCRADLEHDRRATLRVAV